MIALIVSLSVIGGIFLIFAIFKLQNLSKTLI